MDANKKGSIAPLINSLKIIEVFKNKNKREEVSVINFIY